ncbi:MAG: RsbRD N-terminal domain-containing protein [Deltaproteobacteria bacterium]|nr:RsbRD N-terminal domain-containing protein [Deltaproteobacteria bacterium]
MLHKRNAIQKRWLKLVLETYPADAHRFLKAQKDRFANPVGFTISEQIENLFGGLLQGADNEGLFSALDRIIRIRAVQDFSPSRAVAFVFGLKRIILEECEKELRGMDSTEELARFQDRIDEVGLLAFDVYMKCREHLFGIRVNEVKTHVSRLLERAGLVCEIPEGEADPEEGSLT